MVTLIDTPKRMPRGMHNWTIPGRGQEFEPLGVQMAPKWDPLKYVLARPFKIFKGSLKGHPTNEVLVTVFARGRLILGLNGSHFGYFCIKSAQRFHGVT